MRPGLFLLSFLTWLAVSCGSSPAPGPQSPGSARPTSAPPPQPESDSPPADDPSGTDPGGTNTPPTGDPGQTNSGDRDWNAHPAIVDQAQPNVIYAMSDVH